MKALLQNLIPQHLLSRLSGQIAESRHPWLKNKLISYFMKHYHINMHEAIRENPQDYLSFNDFFIRQLKPNLRPICPGENAIASPVDGCIAQIGQAKSNQLLQAKDFYFDLENLLGKDVALAKKFYDANFATLYLAPSNYHRVHMPLTGTLVKSIYVPGKLFSVNRMTSELVPHLYSRNERLITVFETETGPMAIILVGALIVGSMQTVWMEHAIRANEILQQTHTGPHLLKGSELGHFKLGSTVILLFPKDSTQWDSALKANTCIQLGQYLGNTCKN